MELRQLKYFVGIVEAGSVSRASASLHVAQPALSTQLARLEGELGTRLLTRSVRGVTPTAAGAAVYEQARLILKHIDVTRTIAAQAAQGPVGPVAVGLPWTVSNLIGLPLLQEVKASMPGVSLSITDEPSSVLTQLLEQGKLDVAITFDDAGGTGLQSSSLVEEPLMLVGTSGSLQGRSDCTLQELADFPLLLLSRPNSVREIMESLWSEHLKSSRLVAEVNAPTLLIEAVKAGVGYSVVPAGSLEESLLRGELEAIPIASGALKRTVYLSTSCIFPPTQATGEVVEVMTRLVHEAVEEGRWRGKWIAAMPTSA